MKISSPAVGKTARVREAGCISTDNSASLFFKSSGAFSEESFLSVPPAQKRQAIMTLKNGCRWGKLRRVMVKGMAWYFPCKNGYECMDRLVCGSRA